jgi:hypothetical protein
MEIRRVITHGVHCDNVTSKFVTTKVTPLCNIIVALKRAVVEEKAADAGATAAGGGGVPRGLKLFRTSL